MCGFPDQAKIRALHERLTLFSPFDAHTIERERRRKCPAGPLNGRLVGLKANIAVKDEIWNAGLHHRAELKAHADATITHKLKSAGARLLPGLNMDAAALGGSTANSTYGRTDNPIKPGHSAGGSSGGSAAAVAASLLDLAVGTDTLGSVRIPASYCGIFGLKPTFGAIGRTGVAPLAPSLDTVGLLCADSHDLLPLLRAVAGHDANDPASRHAPAGWLENDPDTRLAGLRIGLPNQIAEVDCEAEVLAALHRATTKLEDLGVQVKALDAPWWRPRDLRRNAFLVTEAEAAEVFKAELDKGGLLPVPIEKMLNFGRNLKSSELNSCRSSLAAAQANLHQIFSEFDAIITPTTPQRAFGVRQAIPENQAEFTALANVCGVPAIAVPVGVPHDALPASVQIIGPEWSESRLIRLAQQLQDQN